jgi:hypothetical protein
VARDSFNLGHVWTGTAALPKDLIQEILQLSRDEDQYLYKGSVCTAMSVTWSLSRASIFREVVGQ